MNLRRYWVWPIFAALCQGASGAQKSPTDIAASVRQDACTVRLSDGRVRTIVARGNAAPSLQCTSDEKVSCDSSDAEPVDLDGDRFCSTSWRRPAKQVTVSFEKFDGRPFRVEWIEIDRNELKLIATRTFSASRRVELPIDVTRPSRLVRIRRENSGPVTVLASTLASGVWHVPPPRSGGELIVLAPQQSVVRPRQFVLVVGTWKEARPYDDVVVWSALPAATYSLRSVYDLPRLHDVATVELGPDESRLLEARSDAVGAVIVTADRELCNEPVRLSVSQVLDGTVKNVFVSPISDECKWRAVGFDPGDYSVLLSGKSGTVSASVVSIQSQQDAIVELGKKRVMVRGSVTLNSKAFSNGRLAFSLQKPGYQPVLITTDSRGDFEDALPEQGEYSIQLRSLPFLGTLSTTRTLSEGSNQVDWDIKGGRLRIRVDGREPNEPVQLVVRGEASFAGVLLPTDPSDFDLLALPMGQYAVLGSTPSGRVTDDLANATLTSKSPEATVVLRLGLREGRLHVTDESAQPISGALLLAEGRMLREDATGSVSTKGVPAGSYVTAQRDGFVASCRTVKPAVTELVLSRQLGRAVIEFDRSSQIPVGSIVNVPGADCPVPLHMFAWSKAVSTVIGGTAFEFANLPQVETIVVSAGGLAQVFVQGADGRYRVRRH